MTISTGIIKGLTGTKEEQKEKSKEILKKIDTARPYLHRGVKGALPGLLIGGALGKLKGGSGAKMSLIGLGIGAGLGIGDKALENLSKKKEFKKILKSYQEKKLA